MAKKTIVIDGYIGPYQFSKQYIRNELNGHSNDAVTAKISSLGGSVDHALNIYDQFVEHGNVIANLSSFVASSATIIALGAKKTVMNENSFYLIHKLMNWMDEWGYKNEDDIETLIAKLEKEKQQLAKMTLQVAKMYSSKSGKTLKEITDLMKEETWLTAEEAKQWGFVDEIYIPEETVNFLDTKMVAMISASGYPIPSPKRERTSNSLNNTSMTTKKEFVNKTFANADELLAHAKEHFGLEVKAETKEESQNSKFDVKDENSLIAWLKDKFNISPKAKSPEEKKETSAEKVEETQNSEKEAEIAQKEAEIAQLKAQVENLKKGPGAEDTKVARETDKDVKDDKDDSFETYASAKSTWDAINDLTE